MKCSIIIFLLVLFSIPSYTQKLDSIRIKETERIIDKYSEKISDSFSNLVHGITPDIKEGFAIVVKKQVVEGIIDLTCYLLFCILSVITAVYFYRKADFSGDSPSASVILLIFFGVIGLASIAVLFGNMGELIGKIVVPEWYAIDEILRLIN